jgi:hypothetical protein
MAPKRPQDSVCRDGTGLEGLTGGAVNSGFPSYSADGKRIVFRVWDAKEKGLRITTGRQPHRVHPPRGHGEFRHLHDPCQCGGGVRGVENG